MDTYNAASFEYNDSKAIHCHLQNTASENAGFSFSKEVIHNHSGKTGRSDFFFKGQNFGGKYNNNVSKQQRQQRKKTNEQKNQHQLKQRQKNTNRSGHHQTRQTSGKGGGDRKHKDGKRVKVLHSAIQDGCYPSSACDMLQFD